ncbi:hypothetical protein [Actinoallomurus sp. NPDC050550]|uniref:hypothetical protein n=1 Tax=Actinoallomurus sp. NPDC050550 TaxID=3154937 RepID=UPI0033E008AF
MPIGVNHPAWGEVFAWDQAVGVGGGDRYPVVAAAYDWLHNVFPVCTVLKLAARLGLQPVDAFERFGAEQTLSTARLHTFKI